MAEVRTYEAPDLARAKEKLRADVEAMASRGLRPTWTVWVQGRSGWLRRRTGELVVQFDPIRPPEPSAQSAFHSLLSPLTVKLRDLLAAQSEFERELAELREGRGAESSFLGLAALRERRRRRRELERRSRRVEGLVREIELELAKLERLRER
jgi:hypothetical protein